jgi:hypothetical protein
VTIWRSGTVEIHPEVDEDTVTISFHTFDAAGVVFVSADEAERIADELKRAASRAKSPQKSPQQATNARK